MVMMRWFEPRSCSMEMRRTFRWAESLYLLHRVKQYRKMLQILSVADPGCLYRILIFCPSRISDPKSATKERGEKKFVVPPFFL
jgi:hypothetical protein